MGTVQNQNERAYHHLFQTKSIEKQKETKRTAHTANTNREKTTKMKKSEKSVTTKDPD